MLRVATDPVERADAEGKAGLCVGGLFMAMVGLKVTLRAGLFFARSGVDSAADAIVWVCVVSVCC